MNPEKRDRYADIVLNKPILSQNKMQELTAELDVDEDTVVFYSSGDKPKRIPFSPRDQEQFAEAMADTFRILGLDEDDVVLNLGAPAESNHQSGWGMKHGPEAIGATVINDSVEDFASPSARDQWEDVTVVGSLPRMLHSIGDQISNEFGDLQTLFPNVETAMTAGDTFPQSLRDMIQEQWGFNTVRNFYAATEMGVVAAEDGNGDMVLTNDNLYIELLDPDTEMDPETNRVPEDAITAIYDIDEPVTGAGLFSAPDRELLPFIRYRAGDVLTAYPVEDETRIRFEGREDRVINLSGAMVYPREIEEAVRAYDEDIDWRHIVRSAVENRSPQNLVNGIHRYNEATEWNAVVSVEDDYPVLDVYLSAPVEQDIVPYLAKENETIETWYDSGAIKIRQHTYESRDELATYLAEYDLDTDLLAADRKVTRIGFDASYRE